MRIALCDRDTNSLYVTKRIIYKYAEQMKIDILVDCFVCGEELLESKENYSLLFLGYRLSGKNGLEIAKEIRKSRSEVFIIFISDYTDFVYEAFKVNAYRFLVWPIKEAEMIDALNDFFFTHASNYPLWIKNNQDIDCINSGEIVYLEADNKYCYIHTTKETLHCKRTMARVYSILPQNHFLKINRAFIANLDYISKYSNEYVYFKNGEKAPIGRNYLGEFKSEYKSYLNPKII